MEKVNKNKKITIIAIVCLILACSLFMFGCTATKTNTQQDITNTKDVVNKLVDNQPTPTDINYSLERYNLIRRAYWVNGQREKAIALPCEIVRPLGYIVLFSNSGAVIGRFIVDGKVSSLNSFLTPNMVQDWKSKNSGVIVETELPDIDGSYGENIEGIFFFTTDGKYLEWTGDFLYSDIPFSVDDPILKTEDNQ